MVANGVLYEGITVTEASSYIYEREEDHAQESVLSPLSVLVELPYMVVDANCTRPGTSSSVVLEADI